MPQAQTYYLVDFENVKDAGLACNRSLTVSEHIHVFSTKNAPKINLETLSAFNNVDFNSHIVPAGNESLAMHLIAYLGYIIGTDTEKNAKNKYVIVSKDTDYDNTIKFLKQLSNVNIVRQSALTPNNKSSKSTAIKAATTTNSTKQNDTSTAKQQKNKNIQKVLSKASCSNEVISYTASLVCKHHESTNAKETIHQALCDKFGDGRGLNIYNHIKKYI